MRSPIFEFTTDLRPNIPLTLKRFQEYTAPKDGDPGKAGSFSTILECCGISLPIAHVTVASAAEFALQSWAKWLDALMAHWESQNPIPKPRLCNSPDAFAQKILHSEQYLRYYPR